MCFRVEHSKSDHAMQEKKEQFTVLMNANVNLFLPQIHSDLIA
jgi:hypothetical protein